MEAMRMSYTAGILLLVAALAVVVGAVVQILQYRRGDHVISRGQFVLRMVIALVLVSIIGGIFFFAVYEWTSPLSALIFGFVLIVITVVVLFLAVADLRLVDRQKHLRQAEIYRGIQELQDLQNESSEDKNE